MSKLTIRPVGIVLVAACIAVATYVAVSVFHVQNTLHDMMLSDEGMMME